MIKKERVGFLKNLSPFR